MILLLYQVLYHLFSHKHFKTLISEVNSGLLAYSKWFQLNKLSLNIKKSNYIIFAGKKKFDHAKVYMKSRVYSTRFLGVIVDEKCSWKEHIDYV